MLVLEPGYIATFEVSVYPHKGKRRGDIKLHSTYQTIRVPVSYEGTKRVLNVQPKQITFEPAFPWQLLLHNDYGIEVSEWMRELCQPQTAPLYIVGAERSVTIDRISTTDPRVVLQQDPRVVRGVRADALDRVLIGHVVFNASMGAEDDNYMPKVRRQFNSLTRPSVLTRGDVDEVLRCNKVWNSLERRSKTQVLAYLTLEASGEKPHVVDVQASLTKPSVLSSSRVDFGLTHAKTVDALPFVILNPGDLPLLVTVVAVDSLQDTPMLSALEQAMDISHADFKSARQHKGVFVATPGSDGGGGHTSNTSASGEESARSYARDSAKSSDALPAYLQASTAAAFAREFGDSLVVDFDAAVRRAAAKDRAFTADDNDDDNDDDDDDDDDDDMGGDANGGVASGHDNGMSLFVFVCLQNERIVGCRASCFSLFLVLMFPPPFLSFLFPVWCARLV